MKEFVKKNFILIIAFSLPLILIIVVALSSVLPSLWLTTNYNFVYASCWDGTSRYYYRCDNYLENRYSVVGGKLQIREAGQYQDSDNDGVVDREENYSARLFLHDTETNESREITEAEAQSLDLNGLITSPDGVTVSGHYDRGAGFFLVFDSGSSYGYYLTKGGARQRLNLINDDNHYYYRNNFQFIGWVVPGRN